MGAAAREHPSPIRCGPVRLS